MPINTSSADSAECSECNEVTKILSRDTRQIFPARVLILGIRHCAPRPTPPFPTLQGCTDTARRPTQPPARQSSHSQRPRSVSQSAMAFVRKPIETEIRSNPHSYLESSTKMHAVRVMATPDSRIHSDPAWGMGTERQRPRPGATNAWKMDQPREGVRSRSHPPSAPPCGNVLP